MVMLSVCVNDDVTRSFCRCPDARLMAGFFPCALVVKRRAYLAFEETAITGSHEGARRSQRSTSRFNSTRSSTSARPNNPDSTTRVFLPWICNARAAVSLHPRARDRSARQTAGERARARNDYQTEGRAASRRDRERRFLWHSSRVREKGHFPHLSLHLFDHTTCAGERATSAARPCMNSSGDITIG